MQGIIAGSIHKEVELRTSKNGSQFATFTIRESVNGKTRWVQCITFSETVIEALQELAAGAPVAISGEIDAEIYAPAGSEAGLIGALRSTRC
jgi:single-stranded DNA-binding protein